MFFVGRGGGARAAANWAEEEETVEYGESEREGGGKRDN
jgi:hypothetical protein